MKLLWIVLLLHCRLPSSCRSRDDLSCWSTCGDRHCGNEHIMIGVAAWKARDSKRVCTWETSSSEGFSLLVFRQSLLVEERNLFFLSRDLHLWDCAVTRYRSAMTTQELHMRWFKKCFEDYAPGDFARTLWPVLRILLELPSHSDFRWV